MPLVLEERLGVMRGVRTEVRTAAGCDTCQTVKTGSTEPHSCRAWAKLHAENNPGHETFFVTERSTIYRSDKEK